MSGVHRSAPQALDHGRQQDRLQLPAVDRELWRREPGGAPARLLPDLLAQTIEVAQLGRLDGLPRQCIAQPQLGELAHRVGQQVDAHAQCRDLVRRLVHLHVDAAGVQAERRGQSADTTADDADLHGRQ